MIGVLQNNPCNKTILDSFKIFQNIWFEYIGLYLPTNNNNEGYDNNDNEGKW